MDKSRPEGAGSFRSRRLLPRLEQAARLAGWAASVSREARVLEEKVREAIVNELQRQAAERRDNLKLGEPEGSLLKIEGQIDLEALAAAIVGSVAGGP